MTGATPNLTSQLAQYKAEWSAYVKRMDDRLHLLRTLKQGTELLLLVSAFLVYYLISCLAQAISTL
jgi:hypothetical protein